MKYLKRFNESLNESDNTIILSMEDVKNLKHNLDYREKGDFMTNYDWSEDTKLHINTNYIEDSGSWNGKEVVIYGLFDECELGYVVSIDGKIEYIIGIYEPHGCSFNEKRGLVTCWGHEDIIKLWLDDSEFEREHTR
jgi:hypothetical protein